VLVDLPWASGITSCIVLLCEIQTPG